MNCVIIKYTICVDTNKIVGIKKNGYKSLFFTISINHNIDLVAWFIIPEENLGNKRISLSKLYRLHYNSKACGLDYYNNVIGLKPSVKGEFKITRKDLLYLLNYLNRKNITDIDIEDVCKNILRR